MAKDSSSDSASKKAAQELKTALGIKEIWQTADGQYFTDCERAVAWAKKTNQTITKY